MVIKTNEQSTVMFWIFIVAAAVLLGGCGEAQPVVVPERVEFDKAVGVYLRQKSMELAIAKYIEFTLAEDGNGATAVIAMKYGGEGYGAKVTAKFSFRFEKVDGVWVVVAHARP